LTKKGSRVFAGSLQAGGAIEVIADQKTVQAAICRPAQFLNFLKKAKKAKSALCIGVFGALGSKKCPKASQTKNGKSACRIGLKWPFRQKVKRQPIKKIYTPPLNGKCALCIGVFGALGVKMASCVFAESLRPGRWPQNGRV
jgi:hypothetical protein